MELTERIFFTLLTINLRTEFHAKTMQLILWELRRAKNQSSNHRGLLGGFSLRQFFGSLDGSSFRFRRFSAYALTRVVELSNSNI